MCHTRCNIGEAIAKRRAFLSEIKHDLHIVNYGDSVRAEAEQIFRRYGRDHKLSFCDAVSFVVVTTLLNDIPTLAFDADFRALGSSSSLRLFQDALLRCPAPFLDVTITKHNHDLPTPPTRARITNTPFAEAGLSAAEFLGRPRGGRPTGAPPRLLRAEK